MFFQDFPSTHPFAYSASSSSSSTTTKGTIYPRPAIVGPVPPRRNQKRPTIDTTIKHNRSSSSSTIQSISSDTDSDKSFILTPRCSRSSSPIFRSNTNTEETEDETTFLSRLSIVSKRLGTSRPRSSQLNSVDVSDYETFSAGFKDIASQFGSVGRRGGMELSERHELVAEGIEAEVEHVELKSAIRVYIKRY